jgi:CO dehydrogenase/acetyl-CoA synthase alpha subunit
VIPVLANVVKPLAKAALKGGLVLYEKSMETFAETKEVVEDLVAEAKAEIAEEKIKGSEVAEEVVKPEG